MSKGLSGQCAVPKLSWAGQLVCLEWVSWTGASMRKIDAFSQTSMFCKRRNVLSVVQFAQFCIACNFLVLFYDHRYVEGRLFSPFMWVVGGTKVFRFGRQAPVSIEPSLLAQFLISFLFFWRQDFSM